MPDNPIKFLSLNETDRETCQALYFYHLLTFVKEYQQYQDQNKMNNTSTLKRILCSLPGIINKYIAILRETIIEKIRCDASLRNDIN